MILPPSGPAGDMEQKAHEGYEWMYVLSGRLRLRLAEHDFIMKAGEVAEFDTRVPHWFGNAGPEPAEVLMLFGPQGERMHVRARPKGSGALADSPEPGRTQLRGAFPRKRYQWGSAARAAGRSRKAHDTAVSRRPTAAASRGAGGRSSRSTRAGTA